MSVVDDFLAELWTLWGIATLVVCLRVWARVALVGWRRLDWDDPLMVLALIFHTAGTVSAYYTVVVFKGLANDGMTEAQRAALDSNPEEWRLRVNGSKTHIIGAIMYTTVLWLLKACWLIYYMRLTDSVNTMRWRIRISWLFLGTTYIAGLFIVIFKCLPLSKQWQIYPNPGNNCEPGNTHLMYVSVMAINTATDLYLMTIPLPVIYKLPIELKKIMLLALFSGGFLVIIFGILRCITLLNVSAYAIPTVSRKPSPEITLKSFMAIVVSNMPMIYSLFRRWYYCARGQSEIQGCLVGQSYPLDSNP
ncbi:hypothetical protein DM02DRAFT_683035 [Periconia macrospinosa]|uniref:Rhodopsin domain-containing protein n=1 Tax=Periconia macrospinosa TaxID=97972 RepID=A0A2V1DLM6_9PLEO|nr:hypothetical protein DM02DRAFT_683035 [Periconia macrospinosa]